MTWSDHEDHDHTIAEMALSPIADEVVAVGAIVVRLLASPSFHRDVCITIRGREAGTVELVVPSEGFRGHLMEQRGWLRPRPLGSGPTIDLELAEATVGVEVFAAFRKTLAKIDRAALADVQETGRDGMLVRAELRDDLGYLRFAAWGTSRASSPAQHRFLRAILDLVVGGFATGDHIALIRERILPLYRYMGEKPPT